MTHYLICSTPRVGSNLLSSLMNATGRVGHPREYFCPLQIAQYGPEHCGLDRVTNGAEFHRYLDAMARAFGTDGTFGIKAHLHQLRRALELGYNFDERRPERFIYLTRADIIGQALSHSRAQQTGAWTANHRERGTPRFEPKVVRETIRLLNTENAAWEALFRAYDIEPLRMTYEGLVGDLAGELGRVLEFLGVPRHEVDLTAAVRAATSYFKPQRDALTEEWRARYDEWVGGRAARTAHAVAD